MLNSDAAGSSGSQELPGVIPLECADGVAKAQSFDGRAFPQIPYLHAGLASDHCREPGPVLGKVKSFDGTANVENSRGCTALDIEESDLAIDTASGKQMSIGMELATGKF